ncbi:MAG: hypothetical protein UV71_C0003G0058 [Microgenomates group bacterium GW2011_GWC1_43_13]|uniref:Uncharacterized protein n=3 Tax=Candidatus Woeseibacteriota TaxID=1752722 RepID=A0A837ICG8_9BACT|nr:MAG: hypothetical protein UV71_C0003G0058 [Microgenomates group bacterium GW2011_GWC1_43_13]KKT33440.1 MAG: hypothetical protein UW20_C0002G0031 [Candidatus Woesebacteria bacterium GW2011_GWB1_44_11]KKT54865.1 MAG: hypothetical protein UW47_C0002G0049 [Candidatus Woesebacteria bacterium GW2011_GWA1_44_23]OGM76025.1 MAG: hypothetical protein A2208_03035 [Candidatus Woesebacteria bacterium RIFOXYA1_FULL_43_16]OGM81983.1 MAG: hypothetical protein A2394_03200 [Candidatus Woesebacteria bacterium 
MASTPEIPGPEPQVEEIKEAEFIVPETLSLSGVKVVQKNFTAQVKGDKGQPLIQTPPSQVITVQPPADAKTLTTWSKGSIESSLTWLGMFWIRVIKRAVYFGWRILGKT